MNRKYNQQQHLHKKDVFCSINSVTHLCKLLKIDKRRLLLMAQQPQYKTFTIPKKGGGERKIDTPNAAQKKLLARLNIYLQSTYYFEKSSASYGFIVGVRNDEDRRNVMTNARKHLGKKYLLNVDLKNFFHTISRDRISDIFAGPPFNFKRELPNLLADLTTYNGRLPMGTSTSPVLSNFACRALDKDLLELSENMLWVYTRYADDMSFSTNQPIHAEKLNSIRSIIKKSGFVVNESKVKFFGPEDQKIVTGLLLLKNKATLAPDYLPRLQAEVARLKDIIVVQNEQGQLSTRWVEQFKKQIKGRLNFAGFVLGRRDQRYMDIRDTYYEALHPPDEDFGAISWRGFPYNA